MSDLYVPTIDPDADTLTAALTWAKVGWYCGPLKPGTKHPGSRLGEGWPAKTSRDPQVITSWFAGRNDGLFIHVGRSGGVAVDSDDPDRMPGELVAACKQAPYQSTRPDHRGRGHYLFQQPPGRVLGNSKGKLKGGWGEIRGRNGVIVVAPTPHPDGGEYRWQRTGRCPVLPEAVADQLADSRDPESTATDEELTAFLKAHDRSERPELLKAVTNYYTAKIEDGESRHETATVAACWAMREAAVGMYSAHDAALELRDMFIESMTTSRNGGRDAQATDVSRDEYRGIVAWAVGQVEGEDLDELRRKINERAPDDAEVFGNGQQPPPELPPPVTLEKCHEIFQRWLGEHYDTDSLDAMLATLAAERLGGDPLWLLIISGAGNAKTETVQAAVGAGALITSTVTSEAALLSGTPKKDRAKDATGGLLRQIGECGLLVIKDVTSILSMNRDTRAAVLAAIREIHDGHWVRYLGADGGRTLTWKGRIVILGAVTTAWDRAHSVIASMGDRFVLLRTDSGANRSAAGRKAIANTAQETEMRAELAAVVGGVIAGADLTDHALTEAETGCLIDAADLVTRARTGVDYDYQGNVVDCHAPEMPTRFAKQLGQIIRGGASIGMDRQRAMQLAIRCARDSVPPLRLAIIDDVAAHPASTTNEVRRRLNKPWKTIDRQLQSLHILEVLTVDEIDEDGRTVWRYYLEDGIDPEALIFSAEMSPHSLLGSKEKGEGRKSPPKGCSDISATLPGDDASVTTEGAYRMAKARRDAGQPLTELDQRVLKFHEGELGPLDEEPF